MTLHASHGGYKQGNVGFDDGGTPTNCSDDLAEPDHWVLPVIRAEQVKCLDNWDGNSCWTQSCWIDDSTDKFTALKDVLETAAADYSTALENNGFDPHPTACDCHCATYGCEGPAAD